jgi:hypothetical protein
VEEGLVCFARLVNVKEEEKEKKNNKEFSLMTKAKLEFASC